MENRERRRIGMFGMVPIYALHKITSINELKALTGISSYQGTNMEAFPSLDKLAARIGLSLQATSVAISGLVKKNIVVRKRNYGKVNTYYVLHETESQEGNLQHNRQVKKKIRSGKLKQSMQLSENIGYQRSSDIDNPITPDVDNPISSDIILKEHSKQQHKITDPFFPAHDFEGSKLVHQVIEQHYIERYKQKLKSDPIHCGKIFELLISENKVDELKEKIIQFYFTDYWGIKQQAHPSPLLLFKAWDSLDESKVPSWAREGFASQDEYNRSKPTETKTWNVPTFTPIVHDPDAIDAWGREMKAGIG
jgi:hypothetical protein